jgi:uncharacterized protein (DUF58 family)
MVREYDSTEPLDLVMVVEAWVPAAPTATDRDRLEAAVSLAASVFWTWCHGEESPVVTLALLDRTFAARTGRADDRFAREALTLLASAEGTPDTRAVAADVPRRRSSRCARILISSRPNSPLLADLRGRSGVPYVPLHPSEAVAWYTPPRPPPPPEGGPWQSPVALHGRLAGGGLAPDANPRPHH